MAWYDKTSYGLLHIFRIRMVKEAYSSPAAQLNSAVLLKTLPTLPEAPFTQAVASLSVRPVKSLYPLLTFRICLGNL